MYQYQDPPETQSPEQRSVVFASLANLFTFLIIAILCQDWIEHHVKGRTEFWITIAVPILVSVLILHMGCLWATWPWMVRLVMLSLLSGLMLAAMLAYLFIMMITGLFYLSMFLQQRGC